MIIYNELLYLRG